MWLFYSIYIINPHTIIPLNCCDFFFHRQIIVLRWKKVVFRSPFLSQSTLDFWYHNNSSLSRIKSRSLLILASNLMRPLSVREERVFCTPSSRANRILFCLKILSKTCLFHNCNSSDKCERVGIESACLFHLSPHKFLEILMCKPWGLEPKGRLIECSGAKSIWGDENRAVIWLCHRR